MSRTLSCLIWRIVVAKSGEWTEDAFELIEFITTQFRQVDYRDWPTTRACVLMGSELGGTYGAAALAISSRLEASALLSRMTFQRVFERRIAGGCHLLLALY